MSSFGRLFRVTTYGESHGLSVGCIVDGVPPLLELSEADIQPQLDRRKPNQNSLLSVRNEPDLVTIQSGLQNGITLGTPICLTVNNIDMKKEDYLKFSNIPRPGHADYTYLSKYGIKASSGGGRSSARETIGRVAAGSVAEKFIKKKFGTEIVSWVSSIGDSRIPKDVSEKLIYNPPSKYELDVMSKFDIYEKLDVERLEQKFSYINYSFKENLLFTNDFHKKFFIFSNKNDDFEDINDCLDHSKIKISQENPKILEIGNIRYEYKESIITRCPHLETSLKMIRTIIEVKLKDDSIGGVVTCVIKNCPASIGEPCFDKLEADLAKAMLSIPATKGFEIGSGFEGTKLKGSEHNDLFVLNSSKNNKLNDLSLFKIDNVSCKTNNSGGTLGGISNGENIFFNVAFKPVSTIGLEQETSDYQGKECKLLAKGRHDPCVLPRAMPIVEGMTAITLMDHCLIQASRLISKDLEYHIESEI